jgi:two-component system response regulator DegU
MGRYIHNDVRFCRQMKLRIVVVDDSPSFLEKLVSILEIEFDVVKTAMEGKSSLEIITNCQPDVVVLDLEMPGLNGIEITRELMKYNPKPAIVICSVENDMEVVEAAQKAGALGYVFKARAARDLNEAVKSVARGQSFVSKD